MIIGKKSIKITMCIVLIFLMACDKKQTVKKMENAILRKPILDTKTANYLYHFAFNCIEQEYPNKLNQVINGEEDLLSPKKLHPSFYGCFDWHSSVHGHWALVSIINELPNFDRSRAIISKLQKTITADNILKEITYFDRKYNENYERTYGWAWFLKLAEAVKDSPLEEVKALDSNLQPLTDLLSKKLSNFLDKLNYPIRVGEHPNTAFGLSLSLDYALKYDKNLAEKIKMKAKQYYLTDTKCPLDWEPGGFDFLSPCLQEASLVRKVLSANEYKIWLDDFLPNFQENPAIYLSIAKTSDRSDGKMAHLDGLNFSRAWCLYEIGNQLHNTEIQNLATKHYNFSFSKMNQGEYMGSHWLASFTLYAIFKASNK